jgi:hypothetical protein
MINTKTVVLLIAASVLVAAVAGLAFAQYVSAQLNGTANSTSQTPQGNTGASNANSQQGYSPYGQPQYWYYYGCGRGMCGYFR